MFGSRYRTPMEGAREPPKTEGVLLLDLPPTNQPGAFPRELLPGGERILFEAHPSLLGLYAGRIVLILLLLPLFIYVIVGLPTNFFGYFVVGLLLFLLVYLVLLQRAEAFAMTDSRVIAVRGVRHGRFVEARYEEVQNMTLVPGWSGGIRFDGTPPNAPTNFLGGRKFAKTVEWRALPQAPRVYAFVQEAFALHSYQSAQRGLREMLQAKMHEDRIPCAYCRTLVDIRTVDFGSPKCPSCGAPLAGA